MPTRRDFLRFAIGVTAVACAGDVPPDEQLLDASTRGDAAPGAPDGAAAAVPDASPASCDAGFATVHDTNAQALYFDGTYGPLTGTVTAQQIAAGVPVDFVFWHGHGGVDHRFTLTAAHMTALLRGERVDLMTTTVDGHEHQLFVDPTDPDYAAGPDMLVARPC